MPRKKKTTVEEVIPDMPGPRADALPEFGEITDEQLPQGTDTMLDELGDDVEKIILWKRQAGRLVYVGTLEADEFSLDYVARQWGGGRYLGRLRGASGFLKNRSRAFYIDETIKPEPTPVASPAGAQAALVEKLLDKLTDRAQADGRNPMEIAASLGQVAATQMQTMMTAMLPLIERITSGGGGKGAQANDILEAVQLGITLSGKDEGYMPVIREVGVPLVKALERQMLLPKGAVPSPATPTTTEGIVQPQANAAGVPPWVEMLRPHIAKVLEFARRGADPGTVASAIDLQYPRLAKWLEQAMAEGDFESQVAQYFPEVQPVRAWVGALLMEFAPEPPAPAKGDN